MSLEDFISYHDEIEAFMRLNVHLEHCRRHPIDIRRYKALNY